MAATKVMINDNGEFEVRKQDGELLGRFPCRSTADFFKEAIDSLVNDALLEDNYRVQTERTRAA